MQNPYIIYNENGSDYILQRNFPNYIGRVTHKLERQIAQYPVAGYDLYISFVGTLNGNFIQMDSLAIQHTEEIMSGMSSYFVQKLNKEKYEKHKI